MLNCNTNKFVSSLGCELELELEELGNFGQTQTQKKNF